jgi:hypothetical protein
MNRKKKGTQNVPMLPHMILTWSLMVPLVILSSCRLFQGTSGSSLAQNTEINVNFDPNPNVRDDLNVHAFDANPREVRIGDPVYLTWFAPLAESVEIAGVSGNLPSTGYLTVWPDQTKTYQLIARRTIDGRVFETNRFLTVFAEMVVGPPTIWSFRLDKNGVAPNELTNLRWRARGCTWVRITATNGFTAEKECIVDEDTLPVNTPVTMTYTLELLNSNRRMITFAQATLEVIKEERTPIITRFESGEPGRTLIDAGSTIALFWEAAEATDVRINADPSFVGSIPDLSRLPASGVIYAQPTQDTTYVITAANGARTATRQYRIRVAPGANITKFDANPPQIPHRSQTTLTWKAANCTQAELSGPQINESVPCSGTKTYSLEQSSSFRLKAMSASGSFVSRDFIVGVDPPQPASPEIDQFTSSAPRIPLGETVTLSWVTRNGAKVEIVGLSPPEVQAQGTLVIKPVATTTLTLRVYGADPSQPPKSWPLTIEVYKPTLKINFFKADKNLVPLGSTVNLSWNIANCSEIKIYSLSVSSKKPIFSATSSCVGTYKAQVKKGTTFRIVASATQNQSSFADVVVGAGKDEVDGWFNMLKQVPED